jgi:hypothetical protein
LNELGRVRLSRSFFFRDFLFSDIAAIHGLPNVPDDPDLAIAAGQRLCEELLEPMQDIFGRIAIRSAYRSAEVNALGAEMQRAGRKGYTCAADNDARHVWDRRDANGMGATACIVVPAFWDRFQAEGDWRRLAWWIHDHLPYSELEFYPTYWAFNIGWHERPRRTISSMVPGSRGYLTRPGAPDHDVDHRAEWECIV